MQITNPALSQSIGNSFNRPQQPDRYPVRPVTIEGQVVNDEENNRSAQSLSQDDPTKQSASQFALENIGEQQLIQAVANPNSASELQRQETQQEYSPTILSNGITSPQNDSNEPVYPLGNRKSFNGLAGSSLIIQNYLNNTPSSLTQTGESGIIDFFV